MPEFEISATSRQDFIDQLERVKDGDIPEGNCYMQISATLLYKLLTEKEE